MKPPSPELSLPLLAAGLFSIAALRSPAPQDKPVEVVDHPVAGPVHYLEGQGGNIGVSAGEDGILMIDDQFAELAPKIRAALEKLGGTVSKGEPRVLLNTHHHGDHTGGNDEFGRVATIVAHENVRRRLESPAPRAGGSSEPMAREGLPLVTYTDGVTLHFNGEAIRVVHFPSGHTDGDSVVFFTGSNVVHMGDLFFSGRFPFVDLDGGGSVRGLHANVGRILAELKDDAKVIPGHGPLSSKADLAKYHAMLGDALELAGRALAAGKTAEQMKKEKLLAKYEAWSWSFVNADRFVDTLARELSGK